MKKMSSYKNFQDDNFKFTKESSRLVADNPAFNSQVKISDLKKDSFEDNFETWVEFLQWARWFPDLFYDLIKPEKGGMRLDLDQRVFLRCMSRFVSTYGVFPRGFGKTMLELMSIYHTCIFFADINVAMSAQTKENAASISEDKHKELMKKFPLLQNEIVKPSFSKDSAEVIFKSGSTYSILANAQSTKGQRRHRLNIEESALLNNELFKDALEPVVNVPRRTIGEMSVISPFELNGMINFVTTSGYRGSDEFNRILNMIKETANLKGKMVLGASWELPCHYGRGETRNQLLAKKNDPTTSATAFAMNYESKWVGATDGALVNISKLLKIRTIDKPELNCPKDKRGNFELNEYIFGVDVARSNSQSNNKTAIVVLKIIRNKTGTIRQIQAVNIVEPPNGLSFKEQSLMVKRLFYAYGGNSDMFKSRVKAIVVDGNVIGKGLIDRLLEDHTDPDTNEELGCFDTINTDQKPDVSPAIEVVYDLTAQGINGEIIRTFIDYVETEKLKLLKINDDIKGKSVNSNVNLEEDKARIHTQYLIDEISNLKLESTQKSITVKQVLKKIDKDRYSALAYALYYIFLFMEKEETEEVYDLDDDLVYF
ncbi:hypothetical protein [Cytobacillus gottheilii]|uniref:hypothetical protein n=1 Tax=Cytobacillus gottheilii TaxID=859144 RepID=UPI00111ADDC6|nr:hypothetical protein [Cytobacillus gottheilii]